MDSKNWIGGEWVTPGGEEVLVKNPSKLKEEIGVVHLSGEDHVVQANQAARHALSTWSGLTGAKRGEYLDEMATVLQSHLEEVAILASSEMGKPIAEMRGEVKRGVQVLRYYAGEGVRPIGSVIPSNSANVLQYTKRVPLGVVGIITPWNFPVAIPIWKIAPALISGNTVVWKPAEISSLTATQLIELFAGIGLPAGVLNLVVGKGRTIGNALIEHGDLNGVSFTGSSTTGQHVASICAKRNIKYQTEMGGKNAAIVLDDADLPQAIPMLISGAFRSAGQKCTATSRIIVQEKIYGPFIEALSKAVSELRVGNALNPDVYLGPVASQSQHEKVMSYVQMAHQQANIIVEGTTLVDSSDGHFVKPIIVSGVDSQHALVQEEIFGPVATVLQAGSYDETLSLCNQTIYGLSASLFTRDLSKALRFLEEVDAGMVRVNQETAGVEYQAPFGGMKLSSSHTREQGQAALDFYSQVKTCALNYGI